MESSEEKYIKDYPEPTFIEETTTILRQMKKSVCRIFNTNGSKGTGFFGKIPLTDKTYIPVLITNCHVIQEETEIEIKRYNEKYTRKINLEKRFKYANPKSDIFIIEMKEMKEDYEIEYLDLDDNVIKGNNLNFIGNSIYILQYPGIFGDNKVAVSYGILKERELKEKHNFHHYCWTEYGSSGSPILNLSNNKIIGIHKQRGNGEFNIGAFLSDTINEFLNKYKKKKYY